jgi:hypothetical protein
MSAASAGSEEKKRDQSVESLDRMYTFSLRKQQKPAHANPEDVIKRGLFDSDDHLPLKAVYVGESIKVL